jgi:hypothetical protein
LRASANEITAKQLDAKGLQGKVKTEGAYAEWILLEKIHPKGV